MELDEPISSLGGQAQTDHHPVAGAPENITQTNAPQNTEGLKFEDDTLERLDALYLGHDVVDRRRDTVRKLALKPGEHVLDVGSGPGYLSESIAMAVGPGGKVRGIDVSEQLVERSRWRNDRRWLSYATGDATSLEEPDSAYDVVVSVQVAEYIADTAAVCAEFFRVLKPGGRGLVIATDWDSVIWFSDQPQRMKRVLRCWEKHCADPRLPRHLAPFLRSAGLTVDGVSVYPQVNTDWKEGNYSFHLADFVRGFAQSSGYVPQSDIDEWYGELQQLGKDQRFFFSVSSFAFEVSRPG